MEKFYPIERYNGAYLVNKNGQIWSNKYNRVMLSHITPKGYKALSLRQNGKSKTEFIHRLIAETFIQNLGNKPFVNHIDGNKQNNLIENLEWVTNLENMQHAWRTGLNTYDKNKKKNMSLGPKSVRKLNADDIKQIVGLYKSGQYSYGRIAKMFNVNSGCIFQIMKGRSYKQEAII